MSRRFSRPVIGLAGGIGAGKSEVAAILAEAGCVVVDSDALARQALADPAVISRITEWWGDDVLDASGGVDRRRVADIVFSDETERRRLESVVHPWVEARRREQFEAAPADAPALVIDAPLLFEAGLDAECDAVLFVDADRRTRLERLRAGRGWDEKEVQRREESQWPLDVKRRSADYVIRNHGDRAALAAEVHHALQQITAFQDG